MDIITFLESKSVTEPFLNIDGKNQEYSSNILCLKKFTHLDSIQISNIPNITQIVLSEELKYPVSKLTITNCPNIESLPDKLSRASVKENVSLDKIFDGTTIYNNLSSIEIFDNNVEHIVLKNLTPALRYFDIENCSHIKQLDLYSENPIRVNIFNCSNIQKITHNNKKQRLNIHIEADIIETFANIELPEHTNYLCLRNNYFLDVPYKSFLNFPKYLKKLRLVYIIGLKSLKNLPETIESIDLFDCSIDDMSYLPNSLKTLECSHCYFDPMTLNNFPNSLEKLVICDTYLGPSISFPRFLKELTIHCCKLKKVHVGDSLVSLEIINNPITNIDNLPNSVKYLTCVNCPIEKFNVLPCDLLHFRCGSNKQGDKTNIEFCELPSSLVYFVLDGNRIYPIPRQPSVSYAEKCKISIWNQILYFSNTGVFSHYLKLLTDVSTFVFENCFNTIGYFSKYLKNN